MDPMTLSLERTSKQARKPFVVGTLGWPVDDLRESRIERLWEQGRYEIVQGVLTAMPPAHLDTSPPLLSLVFLLTRHARQKKLGGLFGIEVDVVLGPGRVPVADAV